MSTTARRLSETAIDQLKKVVKISLKHAVITYFLITITCIVSGIVTIHHTEEPHCVILGAALILIGLTLTFVACFYRTKNDEMDPIKTEMPEKNFGEKIYYRVYYARLNRQRSRTFTGTSVFTDTSLPLRKSLRAHDDSILGQKKIDTTNFINGGKSNKEIMPNNDEIPKCKLDEGKSNGYPNSRKQENKMTLDSRD